MALFKRTNIKAGPHIELRWKETETYNVHICEYLLLLPLRANDRRRSDDNHEAGFICHKLGETVDRCRASFKTSPLSEEAQTIMVPIADGQHALWDSVHLGGIPVYATFGDYAMRVGLDRAVPELIS